MSYPSLQRLNSIKIACLGELQSELFTFGAEVILIIKDELTLIIQIPSEHCSVRNFTGLERWVIVEVSLLAAFWAFDELGKIVTDKELTTGNTDGWSVTGISEIEHASAGREVRYKATSAFCMKKGTHYTSPLTSIFPVTASVMRAVRYSWIVSKDS